MAILNGTQRQASNALLEQLATIDPDDIVYADAAGMDSPEDYTCGWHHLGERLHALKSGRRQGRVNMLAAYCNRQLTSPLTIEAAQAKSHSL